MRPIGAAPKLDRTVAIKLLLPELSQDGDLRDRFLREAQAVARLEHPNIVRAFGAGESSTLTIAPAIANAVFDATGERVRDIPLSANRVKGVLEA